MSFAHGPESPAHGSHGSAASARSAPGKRTLTQHLPSGEAPAPSAGAQLAGGKAGAVDVDEAYGLHLNVTKVAPILEGIRDDALVTRSRLIGGVDRAVAVEAAADLLEPALEVAQRTIADSDAAEPHDVLVSLVEAASEQILWIRRWLHSRQATRAQIDLFQRRVVRRTDALRATVGLGATGAMPAPALEENETEEAEGEEADVELARSQHLGELESFNRAFTSGIHRFDKFSVLKRPPPAASGWSELAKAALVAVAGNILGPLGGMLVKQLTRLPKDPATMKAVVKSIESVAEWVSDTTTDLVEGVAGKLADGAFSAQPSENQRARDQQLFIEGLQAIQSNYTEQTQQGVAAAIKDKRISAAAIRALAATFDKTHAEITGITYRAAAHGYALFQAQQGLGMTEDAEGKRTTDQRDYTGVAGEQELMGMRIPVTVRDKRGTTGVGRFKVAVDAVEGRARLEVRSFRINGLNDDMAIAVLERAGQRMSEVGLPLEIEIMPFGLEKYVDHPMLVVDETGELQHAIHWNVLPYASQSGDRPVLSGAEVYASPENLWTALRDLPLAKNTARIVKGG